MSSRERLSKAIDIVKISVALVLVLFLQLRLVERLIVEL